MAHPSITCPECGRATDARYSSCLWCGAALSRPGGRVVEVLRGDRGSDLVINALIVANVAYYLLSLLVSSRTALGGGLFGFLSPDDNSLALLGATGTYPLFRYGLWTLVSANYLHGGALHILFNMMALRQIGPWVCAEFGASRMFVIYTVSGLTGYLLSVLAGVPFTIGASAAVCGLIGALFYFGKSRGGNYGQAVSREVSGWLISLVVFGLIMPGINNWGHGGGIVGGIVTAKLLGYRERSRETALHRVAALFCLLLTVAVLAFGAWKGVRVLSYRYF
ncbi:rhomboid family intramembrane serine protease [Geomonas sp. Red69]|uniref:Rhomboid family intramembrane serine protease n=1 Tax=Geomonas diazotrophica TaxID=2843197 RepID=A0ABX8JIX2_9BACT|nr:MULTISPECIES: rhomboid family intramembrane serine protease [Geomonas]MBU5637421.1 rhomboid family intramembrane serine protease [Geomonas diazotrophica]QWV97911.1 rhomboid family intramembrane serine protease [Geomonas nitrogeniifigens]QXE87051.1 rhomboid family intramembrane serine protease [Geomonas nitrogeniifigens]